MCIVIEWRDGRVVEGGGLENRCRETYPGFESLSLRFFVSFRLVFAMEKLALSSLEKVISPIDIMVLSKLISTFEDSPFPYKVDILDSNDSSEKFKNLIQKDLVELSIK